MVSTPPPTRGCDLGTLEAVSLSCLFSDPPGSLLPHAQCLENCYFVCCVLFCLFWVAGSVQILFLYCGQKSLHWLAVINDHH